MRFSKDQRVLFVVHDLFQEDNHFPFGPAYLAAVLHRDGAFVEAYCMDVFHYTNAQLSAHLADNRYDLIGVGFLAARFRTVVGLCETINEAKGSGWLVLGGHGPSPIPEYSLRTTGADVVAIGEAEQTIVEILQCKTSGGDLAQVDGVAFIDERGEFVQTPRRSPVKDLDSIPLPLWDIFPMERYTACLKAFNQEPHERSLGILTSRGCVNRCSFCYRLEEGIRLRTLPGVVQELLILKERFGVTCYFLQDELFVVNKKRLRQFEAALDAAQLKIKFNSSNARANVMDEELVGILKRCGCQFINFGFESSSPKVLAEMNKNVTVEQNILALEVVRKVGGIGMGLNFIWNNVGDDEWSLRDNAELVKRYNTYLQVRTIRPTTPYPGCDLYDRLVAEGRLTGPADFFERFTNSDLMLVNLMEMTDERAYELLLEVNTDLIKDHFRNTSGDMAEAQRLINGLEGLYSGRDLSFRGARHYNTDQDG